MTRTARRKSSRKSPLPESKSSRRRAADQKTAKRTADKSVKRASRPRAPAVRMFGLLNYRHPDAFGKMLGYRVTSVNTRKKTAITELKVRYEHLSPAGRVHGGVVAAFFDYACGAALFPLLGPNDFCSTVELKVNYFRPLELKDHLIAETQVVFKGKRLSVIHGYVYRRGEKEPVAMATATYNIVTPKSSESSRKNSRF